MTPKWFLQNSQTMTKDQYCEMMVKRYHPHYKWTRFIPSPDGHLTATAEYKKLIDMIVGK